MNKKKRIVSYIISAILVIFLSATILFVNANATILNSSNVKSKIAEANYYEEVYNIIIDSCNNYVMQSGFEDTILNGVISKEDVEKDVKGLIDYMYEGKEYSVQTQGIRASLDKNIENYISENNYAVSEENKKSIEVFEKTIEDTYKRNIEYSNETIKVIAKYLKTAKRVVSIAMVILAVLSIVLLVIVYKVSKPSTGIAMLSTGALFIALKCYSGVNVAINNILVLNRPFSNTLISVVQQLLQNMFIVGIILTIAGIVWIVVFEMKRKIKRMLLLEEHSQVIR